MDHAEIIFRGQEECDLTFRKTIFDEQFRLQNMNRHFLTLVNVWKNCSYRFADWILSLNADLAFTETSITETGIVNASFIQRHKHDFQCANLCIDEGKPIERVHFVTNQVASIRKLFQEEALDQEIMNYLVSYDDLQTTHLIVDSSWVIELIKVTGIILCSISNISTPDIQL